MKSAAKTTNASFKEKKKHKVTKSKTKANTESKKIQQHALLDIVLTQCVQGPGKSRKIRESEEKW